MLFLTSPPSSSTLLVAWPLLFANLTQFVDAPKHYAAAQQASSLVCALRATELSVALSLAMIAWLLEPETKQPLNDPVAHLVSSVQDLRQRPGEEIEKAMCIRISKYQCGSMHIYILRFAKSKNWGVERFLGLYRLLDARVWPGSSWLLCILVHYVCMVIRRIDFLKYLKISLQKPSGGAVVGRHRALWWSLCCSTGRSSCPRRAPRPFAVAWRCPTSRS